MLKYKKMEIELKKQQDEKEEKLLDNYRKAQSSNNTYQNFADYPRPPGQTRSSSVQEVVNIIPQSIQDKLMSQNRSEAGSPRQS